MLTKDQALAAMDAHLIRVETERKQRLERRTNIPRRLFPILRQVPREDIAPLLEQAHWHTFKQWTFYLVAFAVIALPVWFLGLRTWLGFGPPLKVGSFPWTFFGMSAMAVTFHLHVRAYLRRAVSLTAFRDVHPNA